MREILHLFITSRRRSQLTKASRTGLVFLVTLENVESVYMVDALCYIADSKRQCSASHSPSTCVSCVGKSAYCKGMIDLTNPIETGKLAF